MPNNVSATPLRMAVIFFKTDGGNEPALDFIKELPKDDRSKIGFELKTLQIGFPVGMPLCRALGDGLFEMRTSLPSTREARLLFLTHGQKLIVLSGFIKKSQKTPESEMRTARERKKAYQSRSP